MQTSHRVTGLAGILAVACLAELAPGAQPAGTLYATDVRDKTLIAIDRSTGAPTAIATLHETVQITGLAWDSSSGVMYGVDNGNSGGGDVLRTINLTTGTTAVVGSLDPTRSIDMLGLAYDSDSDLLYGTAFVVGSVLQSVLFTIDRNTGLATEVGSNGIGRNVAGLAYDWTADIMYGVDTNLDELVTVDRITGAAAPVGPFGEGGVYSGLAFDGQSLWTDRNPSDLGTEFEQLAALDAENGTATIVGSMEPYENVQGLEFVVPEPTTFVVLAVGSLAVIRRRRQLPTRRSCYVESSGHSLAPMFG